MRRFERSPSVGMNPMGLGRQARGIALLKGLQVAGMVVFTIVVPRLMGPDRFGQFAVVLSVSVLWMTTSALGGRYVFGRFVPEYVSRGEDARVREVFMHVLVTRLATIAVAAPLLAVFLRRLLPDLSTVALVTAVATFVVMTTASPMFAVFFGLNRLAISMSRESTSRLVLLAMLVLLGGFASLERATLAFLATHGLLLAIGLVLAWGLFTLDRSAFHLPSLLMHVRFGVAVFAANLLLRIPWRLGETVLALWKVDSAEIAYFNIALSATVSFTRILGSLTTLLIPSLSLLQAAGDRQGRDQSLGLALKYLSIAGGLFVLTVFALGPWAVATLLGPAYVPVLPNLFVVALAALGVPYIRIAISLAVVRSRVARNVQLGVAAVVVFSLAALTLVPRFASLGASAALVLAVISAAVVAVAQIRGSGVLAVARVRSHLLVAVIPAVLLLAVDHTPLVAVVATGLYVALLFAVGIVSGVELRQLLDETRRHRRPGDAE